MLLWNFVCAGIAIHFLLFVAGKLQVLLNEQSVFVFYVMPNVLAAENNSIWSTRQYKSCPCHLKVEFDRKS